MIKICILEVNTMCKNLLKVLALALLIGGIFSGCAERPSADEDGSPAENFTTLTVDKWTNGEIVKLKNDKADEQWFKFIATASTQRIYVKFSTLTEMYVYLYDADSNQVGDKLDTSGSASYVKYLEKALTKGETYYIKVTGGYWNRTGTYWIGFTDFPAQPETNITELIIDTWKNGSIVQPANDGTGEQWFKFVATASNQRVYVKFSTLTELYAYLYDDSFNQVGDKLDTSGNAGYVKYFEKSLTKDRTYYIKVTGGYWDRSGMYWIGFTDFPAQPETEITELIADKWKDGSIVQPSSDGTGEQWFKFVAEASTQYLYVKFGTLTESYAYLYDSSYNQIGSKLDVNGSFGSIKSSEKLLSVGKTYYIKVTGGYWDKSGTYWITFNSTGTEPQ